MHCKAGVCGGVVGWLTGWLIVCCADGPKESENA